jgi:hypothetical protein
MRLIRIFVSSPGDCVAERAVLDEVVDRINDSEGERAGLFLRLFKWEDDVVPRIGSPPQTVVDEQTPLCDIYLGIMSSRFGGDGTRESGTEHEFRRALERWGDTAQPWVLFYFNDEPPRAKSSDENRQLTRVLEFREELERQGIVGRYAGVRGSESGFFEQVDLHLRRLLQRPEFDAATSTSGRQSRKPAAQPVSSQPIVPVDYIRWLQSTRCANVDLFGLEPKHGSAAKLHSIYVPLTTAPAADNIDDAADSRSPRRAARAVLEPEPDRPTLLLDRLGRESLYVSGAPGSGKSTFCRWVAWLACEGRLPAVLAVDPPEKGCRFCSASANSGARFPSVRDHRISRAPIWRRRWRDGSMQTARPFRASSFSVTSRTERRSSSSTAWTKCR